MKSNKKVMYKNKIKNRSQVLLPELVKYKD